MDDEMRMLVAKQQGHSETILWVDVHGWKLPPRSPGRVRLALARSLVALAVRLAPTVTLPPPRSQRAASNLA